MSFLFCDAESREALNTAGDRVLLIGGYLGYANFGDVLQLKGAIRWHRDNTGLEPVLVCDVKAITDKDFVRRIRRWFDSKIVLFFSDKPFELDSMQLFRVDSTHGIAHLHVYGGGFLNAYWAESLLEMIETVYDRFGVSHYVLTGQQVDAAVQERLNQHVRKYKPLIAGGRDCESVKILGDCGVKAVFSFDDAVEPLQALTESVKSTDDKMPAEPNALIHLNISSYACDQTGADNFLQLAEPLNQINDYLSARSGDMPPKVILLQAYSDRRVPQVIDTLGVVQQMEDLFPFADYQVLDIAQLSLNLWTDEQLTLNTQLNPEIAFTCSYHTTLFCGFMGVPCFFNTQNEYYRQKKAGLGLSHGVLNDFLKQPEYLSLHESLEARIEWLQILTSVYEQRVSVAQPKQIIAEDLSHLEVEEWAPKPGVGHIQLVLNRLEEQQRWLEGQYNNWKHTAEERDRVIQELREWISQLEEGKSWLEEQTDSLKKTADEQKYLLDQLLDTKWVRLGLKLGLVNLHKLRGHK
ncbi:MAG: hypothetical protein ACYTF1_14025 [Planctomycetota bacterium]|jgi:hypothetical protein